MCGICGFSGKKDRELLEAMNKALLHRGPDGQGFYEDDEVSLGHRRLSIIDLSSQARQPMCNEDSTVHMVVNGEIYNFKQLRKGLIDLGHTFRSQCDSEVVVHAYEEYGEDFVTRLDGMFALAIWDSRQRNLILARDRIGIKPLYYMHNDSRLMFASEIKAMLQDSNIEKRINEDGFFQYLAFQCIITNETMFKGIYKLEPGHILIWRDNTLIKRQYWSLNEAAGVESDKDEVEDNLINAIKSHLVSDVPVGVLLSGGLDSSSIVAMIYELGIDKIETFTVGFNQPDDEFAFARQVADRFKTRHHEFTVEPHQIKDIFDKIVWHMDEPLADGGAMATYLASSKVKEFVKVVLVGEGGDETLGGYNWHKLSVFPFRFFPNRIKKIFYFYLTTFYKGSSKIPFYIFSTLFKNKKNLFDSMSAFEISHILPNSLLMKVDKMTMAHSLEARVPFLDYKFVLAAMRLSYKKKISLAETKIFLRKLMQKRLPGNILNRRKHGFLLPINRWLGGELREFANDTLFSSSNLSDRLLSRRFKKSIFNKRIGLSAIENNSLLWKLLIFELWYKKYFKEYV